MADGVDPGDPEHVGHDRVGSAAAALGGNAAFLREAHEVPADEEELREAGALDDVELVGELLHDRWRHGVIAPPDAAVAELGEVREGRLAGRHREAGEAVLLEGEVDPAGGRQLPRVRDPCAPGGRRGRIGVGVPGRQSGELGPRLQVVLAARRPELGERLDGAAVADGREHVVELTVLRAGIADVIRDDDRQAQLPGKSGRLSHEPVVAGQKVVEELQGEARPGDTSRGGRPLGTARPPEEPGVALRHCAGTLAVAAQEPPRQLAVATSRKRHEALRVLGEERLRDSWSRLAPGEVGPREEPAEAAIPGVITGEQDEVGAALPCPDAALVLPDRLAVAREAVPDRLRPNRQPVPGHRQGGNRRAGRDRGTPGGVPGSPARGDPGRGHRPAPPPRR